MSGIPHRKGASCSRVQRALAAARRQNYPRLAFAAGHPNDAPAHHWPAWTDRKTVEIAVDPANWPAWTDARLTTIAPDGGAR